MFDYPFLIPPKAQRVTVASPLVTYFLIMKPWSLMIRQLRPWRVVFVQPIEETKPPIKPNKKI
ncbi:hypothetical protein HLBS07_09420 [Vibrio alginolyticus]|nr:hypothetical protein HLBS07_09420 [Vibrio alginolyticus]